MPYQRSRFPEIAAALTAALRSGRYLPGDRLPSENQLAHRYGVSRPTAARALRELQTAGLVERRAGSGSYVRDVGPAGPDRGRLIGLLVPGLGATEVLDPICTGITRLCQSDGWTVLWGEAERPTDAVEEVDRLARYYIERQVDGVFFAPLETVHDRERENVRIAETLREAGIAVVLLDRDLLDFPRRSNFDLVGIDNLVAGMRVGEHLLGHGHQSLCFLARPHYPATTDLRALGARTALERAGALPRGAWPVPGDPTDGAFVRDLMASSPDALVCANDQTAALLIQTLLRLGKSVPTDVAVVGFDDVRYSTLLSVGLTTMRQPLEGIARAAVAAMGERLADPARPPRQILLDAELVVRASCGTHGEL